MSAIGVSIDEAGVAVVTIDHPPINLMTLDVFIDLARAVERLAGDDDARALVFRSLDPDWFIAHFDVEAILSFPTDRQRPTEVNGFHAMCEQLRTMPKPTIAQIDGFCVGGGMALAVCCDIRICGQGSNFAIPAARLGLGYGFLGINRLANLVGPAFTKEIFFTARRFDAEEARIMGLVNRIVEDGAVEAAADEMATTITGNAPLTVDAVKFIANQTRMDESQRDLATCEAMVQTCFDSADYIEGRRAFMEKRKPVWTGS